MGGKVFRVEYDFPVMKFPLSFDDFDQKDLG